MFSETNEWELVFKKQIVVFLAAHEYKRQQNEERKKNNNLQNVSVIYCRVKAH